MNKPKYILHIEDEPDHAFLVRRCFKQLDSKLDLKQLSDGEQVLPLLEEAQEKGAALPDLILLDLRLPKKDGLDVLRELKERKEFKRIPVIVLSTSAAESDLSSAADAYANGYLVKPANLEALKSLMTRVERYWLQCDELGRAIRASSL